MKFGEALFLLIVVVEHLKVAFISADEEKGRIVVNGGGTSLNSGSEPVLVNESF